tara:strand:- start:8779 stop:9534 length:756 start_codon:yes stop_codon:yes gene_type:complete
MLYFKDFGSLLYKFGNEQDPIVFQNISKYADIIDQVRDDISFFNYHNIQEGFRPDQVSIQLYNTPLYYWTFYLLNDDIRQQGWPLPNNELITYVKKNYPNTTITTRENISTKFKVGQTISGGTSGASGKIIRRNLDLGQIVIEGTVAFASSGELMQSTNSSGVVETLSTVSSSAEYNAARHYIDASELIVDLIDPDPGSSTFPFSAPGAQYTEKTNLDVEYDVNENLRIIKVIKPSLMGSLISGYKKSIRE